MKKRFSGISGILLVMVFLIGGCVSAAGLRDLGFVKRPDGSLLHAAAAKNEGHSGPDITTMVISVCEPQCQIVNVSNFGSAGLAETAFTGAVAAWLLAGGHVAGEAVRRPDKFGDVVQNSGSNQAFAGQSQGQGQQSASGQQFKQDMLTGQGSNFQVREY